MESEERLRAHRQHARGRVEVLAAMGRWKEVLQQAQQGLAEFPDDFELRTWVVRARLRLGDGEGALEEARRLVMESPDEEWSYRLLAWSLYQVDDPEALVAAWRAANLAPEEAEPLYALGVMQLDQHLVAEAEDTVKRLLIVAPEMATSFELNCRLLLAQRRYPEAEAAAREALRLDPQDLDPHVLLAEALSKQGRSGEAFEILAQARSLQPADFKPKQQAQSVVGGFVEGAGLLLVLFLATALFGWTALAEGSRFLGATFLICLVAVAVGGVVLVSSFRRCLGRPSPAAKRLLQEVVEGARSQFEAKIVEVISAASTALSLVLATGLLQGRLPGWLSAPVAGALLSVTGAAAIFSGWILIRNRRR